MISAVVPTLGGAGTADTVARILAQELDKRLPPRVVVENRAGANGNVGAATVARSPADGYTFLWGWAGTLATNPALYRDLPFDPARDFDPVVLVGNVPNILVVNRQLGPRTLAEFTAYARANPGKIKNGNDQPGGSSFITIAMFERLLNFKVTRVSYAGYNPTVIALMAGEIDPERVRGLTDASGLTWAEAMAAAGPDPETIGPDPDTLGLFDVFVELHVEQGRALEDTGDLPGAVRQLQQAARLDPRGPASARLREITANSRN